MLFVEDKALQQAFCGKEDNVNAHLRTHHHHHHHHYRLFEIMKSEVSGTSGKDHLENITRDEIEIDSCIRNVSVQTGEEFSPQFLRSLSLRRKLQAAGGGEISQEYQQDRITSGRTIQTGNDYLQEFHKDCGIPRKIADDGTSSRILLGNVTDQFQQKKVGFQFNENEQVVYEYQTGTQICKKDPVNGNEFSDLWGGRELQTEAEQTSYSGESNRYHRKDYTIRGHNNHNPQQPSTYTNEIYNVQAMHHKVDQPHRYQPYSHVSGIPDGSFSEKMKVLCSFGGRILTRPSDGKLRYVGGDTRIISIKKNISYQELMRKTYACCNQPHIIKYQLPGEDLDALISVCSDEDFHHMIDEYHELEKGSQRLRIFLESSNELESPCSSSEARSIQQTDNAYKYVVSVNGITDPSQRKTSGSSSYAASPTESITSFQLDSLSSIHPVDITGSSTNLTTKLSNPTQFIQSPNNVKTLYMRSPSFQQRDATNSQLRVGRDRVDQPAYENSYHLDVTGYQVSPDNITLGAYQQQLDRRFVESRPTSEDHSHGEGSISENMYSVQCLHGQGNLSFKKPVLNESAVRSEKIVISHKQQSPNVVPEMQWRREVAIPSRQNMAPSSILSKLEESASLLQQQDMKTQTPKYENHPVISTSDVGKHYPEWDMVKWMEKNNFNLAFDLDTEEYQHSISPATPLERQHSIATTVSSDTVSNVSMGLQHNTSLEMSRADVNAENPFLLTTSIESNHTLTSGSNENDHLYHEFVIPSSTVSASISRDISLGGSSVDNSGGRSLSQTWDDKKVDYSDGLPPDILLSTTEFLYIQEKTSGGLRTSHTKVASVARSDSKDVEDDKRIRDGSISDATMAEIQAGIHGLQTIKNADLEELRELGCGTFGTVYHGKWRGTDVAIKRIKESCFSGKPSEQDRLTKDFWREAQLLSQLHHPNVVALYGVVRDGPGGTLSTVTEYMANGSLRHVLSEKKRVLNKRKKLIIAQDAAIGMEYLHLKNIVHFDLKCDNLLVNLGDPDRPVCKVGDLGLSRIKRNTLVSGGARGTLPWIAPELLAGSNNRVSEKVDVFSFGIALWELLTGEEPYADMHCGAIIGGIVTNTLRPPIPKRCDQGWKSLMEECWSNDPADRPSFTQITNKLKAMSAHSKKQTRQQQQQQHQQQQHQQQQHQQQPLV